MPETDQSFDLDLTHHFDGSPDEVFEAWTSPDVLRKWWASVATWDGAFAEIDLRIGGRYRIGMRNTDNGDVYVVGGEFREVVHPSRLVYTWTWEGDPESQAGSAGSLVTVEFVEDETGTMVVLRHRGFATPEVRDLHGEGWRGCLANLERRVLIPGRIGSATAKSEEA